MAERFEEQTEIRVSSTTSDASAGASDTAAIRADIRETRERMGETVEEIGERLNPNRLKEQVKQNVRDATIGKVENMARDVAERVDDTRRTAMDTIRDNPVPAAMIGVGLGWLLWSARHESSHDRQSRGGRMGRGSSYRGYGTTGYGTGYGQGLYASERYGESGYGAEGAESDESKMDRVRERASELGERVHDTAEHVGERAHEMADTVAEETRHQAERVESQFYENPLAIGAATLALGVAAGLAVPRTQKEAELMGGARDKLVDRAREVARETKDKVEHVAERTFDDARDTAKQAARDEGLTA